MRSGVTSVTDTFVSLGPSIPHSGLGDGDIEANDGLRWSDMIGTAFVWWGWDSGDAAGSTDLA